MGQIQYPITVIQGVDFYRTITNRLSDGTAKDLTGYTARMKIRASVGGEDVLLELTTENGGIQITAATGVVLVHISPDDQADFPFPGEGVYSLLLINATGSIARKLYGPVTFEQDPSREDAEA